eukprot:CAMPEP_0179972944 /NCGR_PEP_ID=MMETSP0983-20121128/37064_1 /TAXON_ID=483367 /ORGANISM="non described non described, Strain CCMP 2436" /LENGTH=106 /DNA_ID=CAMNT_0021888635 /DNA_START=502 /DNA_END=822 /DNA_ORIENTATION=-
MCRDVCHLRNGAGFHSPQPSVDDAVVPGWQITLPHAPHGQLHAQQRHRAARQLHTRTDALMLATCTRTGRAPPATASTETVLGAAAAGAVKAAAAVVTSARGGLKS